MARRTKGEGTLRKEKTEDGKVGLTSTKMKTARQNAKALPQKPNPNVKKS